MRPVIYYRGIEFEQEELKWASQSLHCTNRLPAIQEGDLVIGRYSMIPFYRDQEKDIEYLGAKLINSYEQHRYIADLGNYVMDLDGMTPTTWSDITAIPDDGRAFVVKGETNSRKSRWLHDMYAKDKATAIDIWNRLSDDGILSQQKLYIREYVPLVKLMDGVNGMPVTKEFRFFVCYGKVLCGGYYWANYAGDLPRMPDISEVPKSFLKEVIRRVGDQSNYYVIDVGLKESGEPIVIELNDGQQSGLSEIHPKELYTSLANALH